MIIEYQAIKTLPAPVSQQTPNVLFIVLDTVRAQSLSLYGYDRETTPRLKDFAATGARFDQALSTAPWTLPSHGSMFTGYHGHELSTNWRVPLDATYPTLAEELRNAGYLTAGFVANLEYCSYVYGINRGFIHYEDFEFSLGELAVSASLIRSIFGIPNERWFTYYELLNRKKAPDINRAFLDWLPQAKEEGRPFFAFLNYFDAHEPYLPPAPYKGMFGKDVDTLPFADLWKNYTPAEAERLQNLYDGAIAFLDFQIGELLDQLRSDGILENTIVIITSDHGEEFSEHGIPSHGHSLYGPSLNVPLIISFPPKVPRGKIVTEWVSLRDLPATIADLTNLQNPGTDQTFPGYSLARYWNDKSIQKDFPPITDPILSELRYAMYLPEWHPVSKGDMKSMVIQDLHYILRGDGKEEIYDLRKDPWETRDLSETVSGQALAACLRKQLDTTISSNTKRANLVSTIQNPDQLPLHHENSPHSCKELINGKEES
ncbi:sulfatase [Candidatus Nitronereus thalassa]|uniref:Sulfatase n=1 Tax=Candidatus Nitronereus thalassa TaxID=3020898 RepID=A0ABU3K3P7_9BACT|nr:sulfatase [Candidatus Nitronereus thalassa]MDT7040988.1 sulfatase [Candidatus Nitronereus thalassa]